MALTRALAADGEQITTTEAVVTSALSTNVTAIMPDAVTTGEDSCIEVFSTSTGSVTLKDNYGHILGTVAAGGSEMFNVQNGAWARVPSIEMLAFRTAQKATAGAVTPTLGTAAPTAIATTTPSAWFKVLLNDGTVGYVPVWK